MLPYQSDDVRRAHERQVQLLTEARIQRLLREAHAAQGASTASTGRPESLVARLYGQLRQRRALRA